MKKLVIIGASGQGRVVADIARNNGYDEIVFLDDNSTSSFCGYYPIVGKSNDFILHKSAEFIVAIGNSKVRETIQTKLEKNGMNIATLIHPRSVVAADVKIGAGTVIMAGAVVNPGTSIGKGCILNTCSSVDHDCIVDAYVHISVGAHVAGTVKIGEHTWIGAGATVINNVEITKACMIGAGAIVVKSLNDSGTYVGVPAKLKSSN